MKKIICDHCGKESTYLKMSYIYRLEIPEGWIYIDINGYYNSDETSVSRRIIQANGEKHYCSKDCFISDFFFLNCKQK